MKKGYYIHFGGTKTSGVAKKIRMQISELQKYFVVEELLIPDVQRTFAQRMFGLLPNQSITREYKGAKLRIVKPDFVYIRRAVADREYYLFLKWLKETWPMCRVIVEIFTYPYDRDEFAKWNAWPFYFKELIYRPKLERVVDRFVTYSSDRKIFGVPCINTMNGVDTDKISIVSGGEKNEGIHLIAVANFQRSHGYERIIEGLYKYKASGKVDVYLHLVGNGGEEARYRCLVKKWKLQDQVIFHGKLVGSELEAVYDKADIAVGVFGLYKVGIRDISSLKISEYLAKGLPIIGGCKENAFVGKKFPYYYEFSNDKTPIAIDEVVEFFERVYVKKREDVVRDIRMFGVKVIDISQVMNPVIKYISG